MQSMTEGSGCYLRLDNQEGLFENDEKGPNMTRSGAESFSQRKRVGQDPDGKISLEERKKASEVGEVSRARPWRTFPALLRGTHFILRIAGSY